VVGESEVSPELAVVFLTGHHREAVAKISARLQEALRPRVMVGCTAEGVIGADDEIEREPGISLLVGWLPKVRFTPFYLSPRQIPDLLSNPSDLATQIATTEDTRGYLLLGDPFTVPADELITALNHLPIRAPAFGGMASAATRPGWNAFLLNDALYVDGVVGVTITGDIALEAVVSQGCRPIGRPLLVTKAEHNLLATLGGRPALEVVEEVIGALSEEERELLSNGLFLGIVIDEYKSEFERGDFLIRNVLGADRNSGIIAIGDFVRAGQTVQFHVRDADTADEDMRQLLQRSRAAGPPEGGLIFSCNGRGTRLFPAPCHDVQTVLDLLPGTPLAGFFAAGEIGPVGGKTFLHGHTASVVLFRAMA
jgi:small ligand-binding sensory domain FIST